MVVNVNRLTLAFLASDTFFVVVSILISCLLTIAVLFCCPCIIFGMYINPRQERASENEISALPKYKYEMSYDEEQNDDRVGENKNLRVFETEPLDYHSIVKALEGCYGLFYSFEPPSDQPSYDESMAEMEVRAAHNVLEACAQVDTIDNVVFTSSATAVIWRVTTESTPSLCDVDERNWSNVNFCKKFKLWHGLSKTLAEKTAWALAMDRGLTMVSVNAGLLLSSDLTITHPYLKGAAGM